MQAYIVADSLSLKNNKSAASFVARWRLAIILFFYFYYYFLTFCITCIMHIACKMRHRCRVTGHIPTAQSKQFCRVQEAECAVQDAKLCSPKRKIVNIFLSPDVKC